MNKLALNGGEAVRKKMLPYGRQWVDEDDILAVSEVLMSDFLTTGSKIDEFENAVCKFTGAKYAVAVNSGTAALHAAMYALQIGPGDEVIIPPITFAATANCIIYQGGTPVFADVEKRTLLIDPKRVEALITPRTKAVIAVDFAGQPCAYEQLVAICDEHGIELVSDACHSIGAEYQGRKVGTLAGMTCFSFHPVKHITTGEGGMIVTDNAEFANRMRRFRNHNINVDSRQRSEAGSWYYEVVDLGYNYRITDFQCALGIRQLSKLSEWVVKRQSIAIRYDAAFENQSLLSPLSINTNTSNAYHLYVIALNFNKLTTDRKVIFSALRAEGIGVNVHYIPVHMHPYYKEHLGTFLGQCPVSEAAYEGIISLPIFPLMTDDDVESVIEAVNKVLEAYAK